MPATDPPDPGAEHALPLESLLRWYIAMGVDAAIDEEPHDRFSILEPPTAPVATRLEASARQSGQPIQLNGVPGAADVLIEQANTIAASAMTIEDLRLAWDDFKGCALSATAARMIFAGGNPRARLMILGAAPGSDDERQGEAFAGQPGVLLDGMLKAIGLSRDTAYLVNVIPWRPPGNRQPTPLEAALCLPFTRRHIALADPALILCLGERAGQLILDTKDPISRMRGRWLSYEGDGKIVKLAVTFSLDYLLSQPLQKKRAWVDLLAFSKMAQLDTR